MERSYLIYDVFTQERFAGNPLAIVLDAEGMDTQAMQAVAREFNLSETVFVLPAAEARHKARIRIFTPDYEMPFAGHPTVGTAVALAERGTGTESADIFVIEEEIGPVRCAVRRETPATFAEFDLPRFSEQLTFDIDVSRLAAALGLDRHAIGFENHVPGLWSAGVPYVAVPVDGLDVIRTIRFDSDKWLDLAPRRENGAPACAYLYCRETARRDSNFHARMFVAGNPSYEDPATGSAAAALSGAIHHFDRPPDGLTVFTIEQGFEMGRPSIIRVELEVSGGAVRSARIGGHAVRVAEGRITA